MMPLAMVAMFLAAVPEWPTSTATPIDFNELTSSVAVSSTADPWKSTSFDYYGGDWRGKHLERYHAGDPLWWSHNHPDDVPPPTPAPTSKPARSPYWWIPGLWALNATELRQAAARGSIRRRRRSLADEAEAKGRRGESSPRPSSIITLPLLERLQENCRREERLACQYADLLEAELKELNEFWGAELVRLAADWWARGSTSLSCETEVAWVELAPQYGLLMMSIVIVLFVMMEMKRDVDHRRPLKVAHAK